jgi:hypothetical protein
MHPASVAAAAAASGSAPAADLRLQLELLSESRDAWKQRAEKAEARLARLRAHLASAEPAAGEGRAHSAPSSTVSPPKRAKHDDTAAAAVAAKPKKSPTCSVCNALLADKQCTERCKREKAKRKAQKLAAKAAAAK